MFCPNCGTENNDAARFCRGCGTVLKAEGADATTFAAQPLAPAMAYGGFWLRVVATLIDGVVLSIVSFIAGAIFGNDPTALVASNIVGIIVGWLYEALLTSSARQGTLGKMALGLIVTDMAGQRLSFGKATGRHFAKYLSALILGIGFLMVAFNPRKQGLHDRLANTLVVKKRQ